jgi:hypothetical protein
MMARRSGEVYALLLQLETEVAFLDYEIEAIPEPLREVINLRVGEVRDIVGMLLDMGVHASP